MSSSNIVEISRVNPYGTVFVSIRQDARTVIRFSCTEPSSTYMKTSTVRPSTDAVHMMMYEISLN